MLGSWPVENYRIDGSDAVPIYFKIYFFAEYSKQTLFWFIA